MHILGALVAGNLTPDAIPTDQWPAITALALQHGLAPMLRWTLKQAGVDIESNPTWQLLAHARCKTAIDWALKERAQLEVDAALQSAGIPAIWLKGSVLARTVYPEPSLRPMGDLDVLVPYEQREAALQIVRDRGYDFYNLPRLIPRSSGDELELRYTHHYHLRGGQMNSIVLELHFNLLGHYEPLPMDRLQWFWGQRRVVKHDNQSSFYTFSPEAHLLYLAAHAVLQHGEAQLYLLRYFDIFQVVSQLPLAWDVLLDQAVALKWTFALERALLNAKEYFSAPVPEEVLEALSKRRPKDEAPPLVIQLQGPDGHWKQMQQRLGRMSMQDRLRMLGRKMFPPQKYMRWRYNIRDGVPTWPYYPYRWFYWGFDLVKTIWIRHVQR